jgi:hypothetical protein
VAEPIIIDGGTGKVTITLPSSAKQLGVGIFTVEPGPGKGFTSIVATGRGTDTEFPLDQGSDDWKIVIK